MLVDLSFDDDISTTLKLGWGGSSEGNVEERGNVGGDSSELACLFARWPWGPRLDYRRTGVGVIGSAGEGVLGVRG